MGTIRIAAVALAALFALVVASSSVEALWSPDLDRYPTLTVPAVEKAVPRRHRVKRSWHRQHRIVRHNRQWTALPATAEQAAAPRQRAPARPAPLPRPRPADAPVTTAEAKPAISPEVLAELRAYVLSQEEAARMDAAPVAPTPPTIIAAIVAPLNIFREFIIRTATAGGTMTRQGHAKAIECLHPVFARRLTAAIREARFSGLPRAGVYSACRPPYLGVGGFRDKFMGMHPYGLAVDMAGIGRPRSRESKLWNVIATRHKLYNPYFNTRKWYEWNHYQPTGIKLVMPGHPLRKTITARGPVNLERMWKVADAMIDKSLDFSARRKIKRPKARYIRYASRR